MKRLAPAPDYRADRSRWAMLVQLSHAATASNAPADLKALADRALAAETSWESLAPYPRGLVCRVLCRTAWAYSRQTDDTLRAQLAPLLIASAGMVDELYAATAEAAPAPLAPTATTPERVYRAPHADS